MLDVAQDLRLGGVALGPAPLLLELVGEGVGVVQALDVAAGARVAVPEPGAADAAAGLEDARRQPQAAQAVEHVQAGEAGADDDNVEGDGRRPADVRLELARVWHGGCLQAVARWPATGSRSKAEDDGGGRRLAAERAIGRLGRDAMGR